MGREDYLVTAGIGFDLDRSSAKKSIGIFEGIMGALNSVSTKAAKDDYAAADAAYGKSLKDIEKKEKKARKDLDEGVKKSAASAQAALDASKMKPPSRASKGALEKAGSTKKNLKKYREAYNENNRMMKKSYGKFAKEAKAMGIKVAEGTKLKLEEFAKSDVEDRKRLINLNKRMVKDEKNRLKTMSKTGKGYKNLKKEIKHLEEQGKAMVNVSEDAYQLEKKVQNTKRKGAKKERKADQLRIKTQKKIVAGLKNQQAAYRKIGQVASATAGRIKAGMTNAFVIGTAAATAFFVKMQPLAASVTEFEKTIVNANSVFNVTSKELYEVSDSMVRFTLKYGVSAQDTATGLYQLASAGLSAADSQVVLQSTMKLAMATQGDHNTLAKLTVQTIMGFGMEMSQVEELTDKFAHSIQKSLIEWQDLASSVKFAMPFFVATGQSIDELLGGLEVLTNRALEAGIAGRGLRQALAQFAKHADDNASAMRKLGIEIMDTEGNMRALHEIAKDASAAFGDVTDLEALTIMLEDMNVRGATAFALLVQNADEFEEAVENISDSAGEATQMADIQQQSLAMQIQLVKNALLAPFLFSDEVGEANNTLNEFTFHISELVQQFTEFFIVTLPDGTQELTDHSRVLKEFVIDALQVAIELIDQLKDIFLESNEGLSSFTTLLHMAVMPLQIMLDILEKLGPNALGWYVQLKVITTIFPVMNLLTMIATYAQMKWMASMIGAKGAGESLSLTTAKLSHQLGVFGIMLGYVEKQTWKETASVWALNWGLIAQTGINDRLAMSWKAVFISVLLVMGIFAGAVITTGKMSDMILILAASVALLAIVLNYYEAISTLGFPAGIAAGLATMAVLLAGMHYARGKIQGYFGIGEGGAAQSVSLGLGGYAGLSSGRQDFDTGGTFLGTYDSGGPTTEHGMAWLQKGETVNSKTGNMLEGGITLNTGDVHVQDGEDFANRVAEALPAAIRRVSDSGGI